MPAAKEIRTKIASIKKTQKITYAMQKVAASKMRRAQLRMQTSMPYAEKIREVVNHLAISDTEYHHSYLQKREQVKRVGYIVVSTDHGLCGGLNVNLFKLVLENANSWQDKSVGADFCLFGKKAEGFFKNMHANIIAQAENFGDAPQVADLLGSVKLCLMLIKAVASIVCILRIMNLLTLWYKSHRLHNYYH